MNQYNAWQKLKAEGRRKQIRSLKARRWTWARIAKKYAISIQRAQQLGK
jgi:hypothetical protein